MTKTEITTLFLRWLATRNLNYVPLLRLPESILCPHWGRVCVWIYNWEGLFVNNLMQKTVLTPYFANSWLHTGVWICGEVKFVANFVSCLNSTLIMPAHPTRGKGGKGVPTSSLWFIHEAFPNPSLSYRDFTVPYMKDFHMAHGTQQNSSCSHCAVTEQWRCGDYPLTY